CESDIYAGAMAGQELRWLTYLPTDLANTTDIFTKALGSGDQQRFRTALGLVPTQPHLLARRFPARRAPLGRCRFVLSARCPRAARAAVSSPHAARAACTPPAQPCAARARLHPALLHPVLPARCPAALPMPPASASAAADCPLLNVLPCTLHCHALPCPALRAPCLSRPRIALRRLLTPLPCPCCTTAPSASALPCPACAPAASAACTVGFARLLLLLPPSRQTEPPSRAAHSSRPAKLPKPSRPTELPLTTATATAVAAAATTVLLLWRLLLFSPSTKRAIW
ncbi:unnamed protein product, partial [Closterium sp. NIES-53]